MAKILSHGLKPNSQEKCVSQALCIFRNTKEYKNSYVFEEFHLFLLFMFELLQAKWTQTFFESFVYF